MEISLSSDLNTWKPGDSGWLLVEVKVLPKWHMYWKNAGESGYPTSIEWSGDEVDFGSLQFPKPKKYEFLEMVIMFMKLVLYFLQKFLSIKTTILEKKFR